MKVTVNTVAALITLCLVQTGCCERQDDKLAAMWYVDASRPDDAGDGKSWAKAKKSIQAAIDKAEPHDTIIVTDGVYAPISTENKTITIQSVNGAEKTIINGGGTTRCATLAPFTPPEIRTNTVLVGFTLTHGFAKEERGGGSHGGTLNNCVLSGNRAEDGGGAAYGVLNNCTLSGNKATGPGGAACANTLNNCTLTGNTAADGGGADLATLNNCVVSSNTATFAGGGVAYGNLNNCVLFGNKAGKYGGGVYGFESLLNNCTLVGNTAREGGGIYGGESDYRRYRLNNCIVFGNSARIGENYAGDIIFCNSCILPLPIGSGYGNIAADPQFVDIANHNFRLQAGSPCIDAGSNENVQGDSDIDGNPRIQNGRVDMGAYESTIQDAERKKDVQPNPANNVRTVMQYFFGGWMAVVAFSDVASKTDLASLMTNDAVRAQLRFPVGEPIAKDRTTLGEALLTALEGLGDLSRRSTFVFVVGDGTACFDDDPTQVISAYKNVGIPVPLFALGSETDSKLAFIAEQTRGKYFGMPKTFMDTKFALMEAIDILADSFLLLKDTVAPVQTGRKDNATALEHVHIPFAIDPSIQRLWFSAGYFGGAEGASLALQRPDGSTMTAPVFIAPDGLATFDLSITNPPSGNWALIGTRQPKTRIDYFAHAVKRGEGPYLSWITTEESPHWGTYRFVVSLNGEASIDKAKVTGQIQFDSGETETFTFSNFRAGIYGAKYRPKKSGYAQVTVTASNPDGKAFNTWRDVLFETWDMDDFRPPADAPVPYNFIRTRSERLYIEKYRFKWSRLF